MRNIVSPLDGFASPFGRRFGAVIDPFASLMSTLLSDATQLIAHPLEYGSMGSMFQDRAGTTPVTAPGQLVGMVLDHGFTGSKPVAGPELVTNGGFDSDTDWTLGTGWSISGGKATCDGTNFATISQPNVVTSDKFYKIYFDVTEYTSGTLKPEVQGSGFGATAGEPVNSVGSYEQLILPAIGQTTFRFLSSSFSGSIDNISVRELPGYHATAISDAARGVFREVDGIRYIEYNGVNTAYSTPSLPAPGVDKAQVFAGAAVLVPRSNNSPIIQIGDGTVSSTDAQLRLITGDGSTDSYRAAMFGSGINQTVRVPKVAPYSAQFTVLFDAAQTGAGEISLREDGLVTSEGSATDSGITAFGSQQIFFGTNQRNTAFSNGRHYATLGPITRFSAANATTAQIEAAEVYYTARVI